MRCVRRLAWAAAVAAATASPAAAQMGGGGGNGGGGGGGGNGGGGNLGNFQTAPTTTAQTGTNGTSGSTDSGAFSQPTLEQSVEKAPIIYRPSYYANSKTNKVQASNFLGPSYANPLAQGVLANARDANYSPGYLGAPTFGTATGATATTTTGRAGGTTATGQTTDPGGQLVQLPRQIAYTAQLKFAVPPMPAPRLQADLRGVIDRARLTANPAGVQVLVDGNAVVLRGAVADGDEARLVEGLVRLTPGVGRISNELTYARP